MVLNWLENSISHLQILKQINRDLHTSRSLEIPACGGFLLAERTVEHEELFTDKAEAVFFDNDHDLLRLVTIYLSNDEERNIIRSNGLKRCIESDYSYNDMVDKILSVVN